MCYPYILTRVYTATDSGDSSSCQRDSTVNRSCVRGPGSAQRMLDVGCKTTVEKRLWTVDEGSIFYLLLHS